jgi:hypothetical protein
VPNLPGDIEKIECDFCASEFIKSWVYKDHMQANHPGEPLQEMVKRKPKRVHKVKLMANYVHKE